MANVSAKNKNERIEMGYKVMEIVVTQLTAKIKAGQQLNRVEQLLFLQYSNALDESLEITQGKIKNENQLQRVY